jgi:hypothetical protein
LRQIQWWIILQKRSYGTPETPRFKLIRPYLDSEFIDPELQSRYRSGVGMLLYLENYSRSDICNVLIELCKCMDGATIRTYLELLRLIKFVLDTEKFCLKIQLKFENKDWNLIVFCDSIWTWYPETRMTATGLIVYLMNVRVCWRSKTRMGIGNKPHAQVI